MNIIEKWLGVPQAKRLLEERREELERVARDQDIDLSYWKENYPELWRD